MGNPLWVKFQRQTAAGCTAVLNNLNLAVDILFIFHFKMEENTDVNRIVVLDAHTNDAPVKQGERKVQQCSTCVDEDDIIASEDTLTTSEETEDIGPWILKLLREMQPDAEITVGSIKALTSLLDTLTARVLEEAKAVSTSDYNSSGAGDTMKAKEPPLTSLDIHKALKRVLPPGDDKPLRPYLPAVTKQAWHLDKKSIKGIKRQKTRAIKNDDE